MLNGLRCINPSFVNGHRSDFVHLKSKLSPSENGVYIPRATLISGGGNLLSHSNGNNVMISEDLNGHESVELEVQPDEAFGALVADTVVTTNGFPVDDDEFDLDRPTEGFASIPDAIEDIRQGKVDYFFLTMSQSFFLMAVEVNDVKSIACVTDDLTFHF